IIVSSEGDNFSAFAFVLLQSENGYDFILSHGGPCQFDASGMTISIPSLMDFLISTASARILLLQGDYMFGIIRVFAGNFMESLIHKSGVGRQAQFFQEIAHIVVNAVEIWQ